MRDLAFVWGVLAMTAAGAVPAGTLVTPDELARRDAWVQASFEQLAPSAPPPGLWVLANNDGVSENNRNGKPLNLAGKFRAANAQHLNL